MARFGRPCIFGSKYDGDVIQGAITKVGSQRFEAARQELATLAAWKLSHVSDGDTIEFLARGVEETKRFLAEKNRP